MAKLVVALERGTVVTENGVMPPEVAMRRIQALKALASVVAQREAKGGGSAVKPEPAFDLGKMLGS